MKDRGIRVLSDQNFIAITSVIPAFQKSRVCMAIIRDEHQVRRNVYLLAHPIGSKGLASCLTLWLVQHYLGVDVSKAAWILDVPGSALKEKWPEIEWPEFHFCWALQEISANSPETFSLRKSVSLKNDMLDWQYLATVVYAHEVLILNSPTPLMRVGRGRYFSIDGTGAFGGEYWQGSDLFRIRTSYNHVARMVDFVDALGVPSDIGLQRMGAVLRDLPDKLGNLEALLEVLQLLLHSDDVAQLIKSIKARLYLRYTRWDCELTTSNDSGR